MLRFASFCLLLLPLSLLSCNREYLHSTPEELAQSVFAIVQSGDRAALDSLIPTQGDVIAALVASEPNQKKKAAGEKLLAKEWERLSTEMIAQIDASWQKLRADLAHAGVDLSQAKFVSAAAKTVEMGDFSQGDIDLVFVAEGTQYAIRIADAGKTPRGWMLSRKGLVWQGKR